MPPCDRVGGCVAIAVYNHARTVGAVVRGALDHASTVLVWDDGSTDGSGEAAARAGATVLAFERNRGKGAALRALFEEARRRGFRYVITLDADGQHLPEDLPRLATAIESAPGALIVGERDLARAGAPGASRFGRRFSNFWVWFETGQRVADSQCGFRAYPLPECAELPVRRARYDFEVEVLLRAAWAGIPLVSTPVEVVYPRDRVTHFRQLADNARISLLNTWACARLLLPLPLARPVRPLERRPGLSLFHLRRWALLGGGGPALRALAFVAGALGAAHAQPLLGAAFAALTGLGALPALFMGLLVSRADLGLTVALPLALLSGLAFGAVEVRGTRRREADQARWSGRSRGGVLGHWVFFQLLRVGLWPARALLYPVTLWYVLTAPGPRRASSAYLTRVLGPASGLSALARSFRHFHAFASTLLERSALSATSGATRARRVTCEEHGLDHLKEAAHAGRGAILLTAHVGSWGVATSLLEGKLEAPLAVVAFQGEEAALARFLSKRQGRGPKVISVGSGELASLDILRALRDGALVAMQGDRSLSGKVVRVPFLGAPAAFPIGPFAIAALSGVPLIPTFALRVGKNRYHFVADAPWRLAFEPGASKDEQLRRWAARYAERLEAIVRAHPLQWFNFYDFWAADPSAPARQR